MRFPALRTLSSRIIGGFAVLIIAFSAVSALTVVAMQRLGSEVRVIRTGYLGLALTTKDLYEKQKSLRLYLNDVQGESSTKKAKQQLLGFQVKRTKLLNDVEKFVAELRNTDLPPIHARQIALTMERVAEYRRLAKAAGKDYKILLQYPPLLRLHPNDGKPSPQYKSGLEALGRVRKAESEMVNKAHFLRVLQQDYIEQTTLRLERNERRLRQYTLYLGLTAIVLGLLITIWATLTLRPLRRLRNAAKRIAAGDYASRIEEKGPAEVADLAREFNVMGQAVEERQRELVRTERLAAVGKMAAMITHEVRNPLSSIGLNTELLEDELRALPEDRHTESLALVRAITKEVDRLTDITEEYLQFARLPNPKPLELDVNSIVRGLVEFERGQLSVRGIEVHDDLASSLPVVRVDDNQLRQALLNLVGNAADAVEERKGNITVSTRATRTSVEIRVEDDGPGISEELGERLFDPFVSGKAGGTGLGLALTQQIILEHGGKISVESEPGSGAIFVVSLPRVSPEDKADAVAASPLQEDPGKLEDIR